MENTQNDFGGIELAKYIITVSTWWSWKKSISLRSGVVLTKLFYVVEKLFHQVKLKICF
jgi:hypothetical protein